jgi:hypothetical protein
MPVFYRAMLAKTVILIEEAWVCDTRSGEEGPCWKNPIRLVSGSNAFQAASRSYDTTSLAVHNLGYSKQFQGSPMSGNLGTPPKLLQAVHVAGGRSNVHLAIY